MFLNLKAEITRNNSSISELAKEMSINRKTLSLKINGKYDFSYSEMKFLKRKFNCGWEYLFMEGEVYDPSQS